MVKKSVFEKVVEAPAEALQKTVEAVEKEEKKIEPVKMLTETGELVEIDPRFLAGKGQKIKPEEIHTWVKNRK